MVSKQQLLARSSTSCSKIFSMHHHAPWHLVGSWLGSGQERVNFCSSQEGWGHRLFDTTLRHEGERSVVQRGVICGTAGLEDFEVWCSVPEWAITCGLFTYLAHSLIGLLISLPFPVNCCYLNQWSSPPVSPILLSSPTVREQEEVKGATQDLQ